MSNDQEIVLGPDEADAPFLGELLDGRTAAGRVVHVRIEVDRLTFLDAETGAPVGGWRLLGLHLEELGSGAIHLTSSDAPGALLSLNDHAAALLLRERLSSRRAFVPATRRAFTAIAYVAALGALGTALWMSLPGISRLLARRVPLNVEQHIALRIETLIEKNICDAPKAQPILQSLVERLSVSDDPVRPGLAVRIYASDTPNAFTLPGGAILVTRGLIKEAGRPEEVAAVIAHELEHVRQRHIMAQIIRSSILSFGWAITVGDFSGLVVIDPATAFQVATLRFSRADERQADDGALARLAAAHLPAAALAEFFERLKSKTDVVPPWLSTHPASAERSERIRGAGASSEKRAHSPAMSPQEWATLKGACGS